MSDKHIKVLLIQDNSGDAQLIEELMVEARNVIFDYDYAGNLSEGMEKLSKGKIDVVLLDLGLPDGSGLETLCKVHALAPAIPIVVVTGLNDEELAVKAVRSGAQDYLIKGGLDSNLLEHAIQYAIERKRAEIELKRSFERLLRVLEETIDSLASVIEIRDPYTAGHQRRVSQLVCAIAKEMGFTEDQITGIKMAALIHDIGKIQVPAEILAKPSILTDKEMEKVRTHPKVGYNLLKTIEFPWLIAQIVYQHHERMNGSGYPKGIKGGDILAESRILAVADVVEAMCSDRPYRPAPGLEEALKEISEKQSLLYDPEVVDACVKLFKKKGFRFE